MLKRFVFCLLTLFTLTAQAEFATRDTVSLWYETFGEKDHPAVLLIMGGCCQGVLWDSHFCEYLADSGFYVIRYDHRDAGLSTCFDFDQTPYSLMDMAKDAICVLDAIFPPDHGKALSEQIAHSELFLLEGMGHVPNNAFYPLYIALLQQQNKTVKRGF